jgi:hypothetical protein
MSVKQEYLKMKVSELMSGPGTVRIGDACRQPASTQGPQTVKLGDACRQPLPTRGPATVRIGDACRAA